MYLDWDYIDIEGFRSFIKPNFLDLYRIGPGLHFVRGENGRNLRLESNGAGKSSIWGALTWCLYGKTVQGLNRLDIKPWPKFGKGPTCVEVCLLIDKKKHYIRRTLKEATLDGKVAPQEKLDRLLGMPFEVFIHTVLHGQGMPLFFDKPPSEKLDLFSAVLYLERWDDRSERAKDEVAEIVKLLVASDSRVASLKAERDRIVKDIEHIEDDSAAWEKERTQKLKGAGSNLAKLKREHEKAANNAATADLAFDGAETELRACRRELSKQEQTLSKYERRLAGLEASEDAAREKLADLQDDLQDLKSSKRCPTCDQLVSTKNIDKHREELRRKIEAARKKVSEAKAPKKLIDDANIEKMAIANSKHHIEDFQKKADRARTEVDRWKPEAARLAAEIAEVNRLTVASTMETNPYLAQKRALEKRLRNIGTDVKRAEGEADRLERRKTRTHAWVKGFKDVKLLEVEECLAELEIATNALLEESGLVGWQVHYAIEKETKSKTIKRGLNVMILSPDNDHGVKWEVWSGGEGQRLRICGQLALSEVLLNYAGVDTSLEILDEPTNAISTGGIRDICEFLADRARRMDRQIFLTDQHALESPAFTSVVTVTRSRDGLSRIEEERA